MKLIFKLDKYIAGIVFLALYFLFSVTVVKGQAKPQKDFLDQLEQLNLKIEQGFANSNDQIEKGDYFQAEESVNQIITGLDVLIDVFMPLHERIKKLLEVEKGILETTNRTRQAKSRRSKEQKQNQKDLVMDQIKNREQTERVIKLIEQQVNSAGKNDPKVKSEETDKSKERTKILKEVSSLLEAAKNHETSAVSFLEDFQYKSAISEENGAIKKLKEALKKMSKESQSQNSQSEKKQQSENQNSEQKKSPQNQSEKEKSQQKQASKAQAEKKLSAKEALKELSKLRKKAEDEKKRRRKKFGEASVAGQAPVEKDW